MSSESDTILHQSIYHTHILRLHQVCVALRDEGLDLLVAMQHDLQHMFLVVLGPGPDRQLRDLHAGVVETGNVAVDVVLGRLHVVDAPHKVFIAGDLVSHSVE